MGSSRRSWLAGVGALLMAASIAVAAEAQTGSRVIVLTLQGPLTPAMAEYLDRGLARAEQELASAVLLQLDTPGGQVDLMNRMVQSIRASTVPVIVYVAPAGAIAGSAGTVLVIAGHVAAMHPQTALGAASPVGAQGEDLGETIESKLKEILRAEIRSLAEGRGEEAVALAEASIEEAKAATAREAHAVGLIDILADDPADLLRQLGGWPVHLPQGDRVLDVQVASLEPLPMSLIEQFLNMLTNPNIVFLLMTLGVQAVLIEISSPGGWVAGFVGVVSLALGAYGLGVLPVNWFGLIFVATAFVLFLLDVKAPTHGALTAAGLASFIVGALVLFNSPGVPSFQRVSVPLVVAAGLVSAVMFFTIVSFAIRAQRRPVEMGGTTLVGKLGEARTPLSPSGMVQVAGELWSAELIPGEKAVGPGERVEVLAVDGLRLRVRPAPARRG
jgi:membrane-bound serine protease (ClpP class)